MANIVLPLYPTIHIKRVYDQPIVADGYRVLVDRLWPRGLNKKGAAINEWAKNLAPSPDLRKWFGHLPERWSVFQKKYQEELINNRAVDDFVNTHQKTALITLVYGAKDGKHTHALVLQSYLNQLFQLRKPRLSS